MSNIDLQLLKCNLERLQELLAKGSLGVGASLRPYTDSPATLISTETVVPHTHKERARKSKKGSDVIRGQKHKSKRFTNVTTPANAVDVEVKLPDLYYR